MTKSKKGGVVEIVIETCDLGSMCDTDTRARLRAEHPKTKLSVFSETIHVDDLGIPVLVYVVRERAP